MEYFPGTMSLGRYTLSYHKCSFFRKLVELLLYYDEAHMSLPWEPDKTLQTSTKILCQVLAT